MKYPEHSSPAQPRWLKEKAIGLGWQLKTVRSRRHGVDIEWWWHPQHGKFTFGYRPGDKNPAWFLYWHDENCGCIGPFASMYGILTAFDDPAFLIQRLLIEDFWRSHGTSEDRCRGCNGLLHPSVITDISLGVCTIVTCGLCGAGNILRPRGNPAPSPLVAQFA